MGELDSILKTALRGAAVTRDVLVGRGALQGLAGLAERSVPGARWMLVADGATWQAAGAAAQQRLQANGATTAEAVVLQAPARLKPLAPTASDLAQRIQAQDAVPLAVGSGVISDLVKYAASLAGKPYLCVATAASMDGYAASGAALLDGAFKRTLPCAPPLAVLADLDVLAAAPAAMAAWGYGDLAGKVVAGADWRLADALGVEPINPGPFGLVQDHLATWLAGPERLAARDPQAFGNLVGGLLVCGFAMQSHGNSRPASGSDHQFSHLWEMEGLAVAGEPASHGACVGVGCVAMLALYEWLLAREDLVARALELPAEHDEAALAREIGAAFTSGELARAARIEMQAKRTLGSRHERLAAWARAWPALRLKLAAQWLGAAEMQRRLRAAGGAAHPADLGLSLAMLARDYRRARLIRRRYTLLDLLDDLGWLDLALAELFAPQGFWGRQAAPGPAQSAQPAGRASVS